MRRALPVPRNSLGGGGTPCAPEAIKFGRKSSHGAWIEYIDLVLSILLDRPVGIIEGSSLDLLAINDQKLVVHDPALGSPAQRNLSLLQERDKRVFSLRLAPIRHDPHGYASACDKQLVSELNVGEIVYRKIERFLRAADESNHFGVAILLRRKTHLSIHRLGDL